MGLTEPTAQFLRHLRSTGVRFRETLTIGHQSIYMDSGDYARQLGELGAKPAAENGYADEFVVISRPTVKIALSPITEYESFGKARTTYAPPIDGALSVATPAAVPPV